MKKYYLISILIILTSIFLIYAYLLNQKNSRVEEIEVEQITREVEQEKISSFISHLREPYQTVKGHKNVFDDFHSSYSLQATGILEDTSFISQIIACRNQESFEKIKLTLANYNNLEALEIVGCKISSQELIEILNVLSQFEHFRKLIIYSCKLNQLPTEIAQIEGLETLALSKNNLVELPNEILRLSNLKYLDLYQNRKFKELPDSIGILENLEYLGIAGCNVRKIPQSIGLLENLIGLTANSTNLEIVPIEIGNCKNLRPLNLGYNKIKIFPKEIGNLTELEYLSISNNLHDYVPVEYKNLKNLYHFN